MRFRGQCVRRTLWELLALFGSGSSRWGRPRIVRVAQKENKKGDLEGGQHSGRASRHGLVGGDLGFLRGSTETKKERLGDCHASRIASLVVTSQLGWGEWAFYAAQQNKKGGFGRGPNSNLSPWWPRKRKYIALMTKEGSFPAFHYRKLPTLQLKSSSCVHLKPSCSGLSVSRKGHCAYTEKLPCLY